MEMLSRSVFCIEEVVKDDAKSSYRNKYIRKVENSKIFHCNKINNMSYEDTLICMCKCSCEYECISSIEKFGFFLILFSDIVIDDPSDQDNREHLEKKSANREREGNSRVI
jgi:hypothetical protein